MSFQRVHQSKSQIPQSSSSTSQFAPRPFPVQEPKRPPTQEDIENEPFQQNKFEATGLQLKEKYGTITPVEQERLGMLQAKMDSFWAQRMERASRFGHNFANIPIHAPNAPVRAIPIQPKLTIGQPNDQYEQEADRVAEQVMNMTPPATPNIQQQAEEEQEEIQTKALIETITPIVQRQEVLEEDEPIQAKCEKCEEEEQVQRSPNGVPQVQADLGNRLNASKGGGSPLPDEVRSFMEPRFKTDFSQVRVHTDSTAVQMNQKLGAQAFTHGSDIYYGGGKTPENNNLTAHELTHVLQQSSFNRIHVGRGSKKLALSTIPHIISPQRIFRQLCHPTSRWPGNMEHSIIESDYVTNVNPSGGALEYAIPESGPNGGTGYADMVDVNGHKIYEIKTYVGAPGGVIEAERYAEKAQEHCAPPIPQNPWSVGNDYPAHTIPFNATEELVVRQYPKFPGVVVYYKRRRRQVPRPLPVPVPETSRQTDEERQRQRRRTSPQPQPVPVPQPAMQQIREFLQQVVQSGQNAEAAAQQFLQQHPELIYVIAGAAIALFLATIAEDILTLGAGIADDPATLAAAAALWRIAMQLRAAQ